MFSRAELYEGALPMVQHTAVQLHRDNRIPEPPGKTTESKVHKSWLIKANLYEQVKGKTNNLFKKTQDLCIKAVLRIF